MSLQATIAKLLLKLPDSLLLRLSGGKPLELGGRTLDPRFQFMMTGAKNQPAMSSLSPQEARAATIVVVELFIDGLFHERMRSAKRFSPIVTRSRATATHDHSSVSRCRSSGSSFDSVVTFCSGARSPNFVRNESGESAVGRLSWGGVVKMSWGGVPMMPGARELERLVVSIRGGSRWSFIASHWKSS